MQLTRNPCQKHRTNLTKKHYEIALEIISEVTISKKDSIDSIYWPKCSFGKNPKRHKIADNIENIQLKKSKLKKNNISPKSTY